MDEFKIKDTKPVVYDMMSSSIWLCTMYVIIVCVFLQYEMM